VHTFILVVNQGDKTNMIFTRTPTQVPYHPSELLYIKSTQDKDLGYVNFEKYVSNSAFASFTYLGWEDRLCIVLLWGLSHAAKLRQIPAQKNKPASERRGKGMLIYFSAKVLWESLLSSKAKV
jgi:hypothetical protein